MRDKAHYLDMLDRNPNATVGVTLAAKAVLAACGWNPDNSTKTFKTHAEAQKHVDTYGWKGYFHSLRQVGDAWVVRYEFREPYGV